MASATSLCIWPTCRFIFCNVSTPAGPNNATLSMIIWSKGAPIPTESTGSLGCQKRLVRICAINTFSKMGLTLYKNAKGSKGKHDIWLSYNTGCILCNKFSWKDEKIGWVNSFFFHQKVMDWITTVVSAVRSFLTGISETKIKTYRIYSRMPSTFGLQAISGGLRLLASTWNLVGQSLLEDSPRTKSSTLAKGMSATVSILSRQPSTLFHTRSPEENSKFGGLCTGRDRISSHLAIYKNTRKLHLVN